jgi:vancomycin resistance protein VanJ
MNPPDSPLSQEGQPGAAPRPSLFRRAVALAIIGYTTALIVLFPAMQFIGERWWPLAVLLYLPQSLFLLPLIVLIPAALLAEVSTGSYCLLGICLIIFFWHLPFYPGISGAPGPATMKLMTNNYDGNHGLSLQPFISQEDPDFVAIEDAENQAGAFRRANPGRIVTAEGQFLLMSKAPITSASFLPWPKWRGAPVAAVFETPWRGQNIAIYVVHLPTPRWDFAKLAGLGVVREILGRNRRRSDGMSFSESMTARVQLARDLASVIAREQRPFVLAGDFNMPPYGYVHRVITGGLTDCFAQSGRGFGFTFPSDSHNPLTLGEPWLRIDYIIAGPGWHSVDCEVEPHRRSEHRPVVATLVRD